MIRAKLIAPTAGAIALLCSIGLSCGVLTSSAASPAAAVQALPKAVLSSRVVQKNVLVGHELAVSGTLEPALATSLVRLQQRRGHGWIDVAAAHSSASGRFVLHAWPRRIGAFTMRVVVSGVPGDADPDGASAKVYVYHQVIASWYGPGGRTACGQELTAYTLGVANKTLPCGTIVTLRYRNRTVRVRVIDRGPYVAGRDYDLTYATKRALRAGDLTLLWATR